jgi:hypothetical protein
MREKRRSAVILRLPENVFLISSDGGYCNGKFSHSSSPSSAMSA